MGLIKNLIYKIHATAKNHLSYRGYFWAYPTDPAVTEDGLAIKDLSSFKVAVETCMFVQQLSLSEVPLKVWPSRMEITRILGIDNSDIGKAIKSKKTCQGFLWGSASNDITLLT